MLALKDIPKGIDVPIQRIQSVIHDAFALYNTGVYGRAYMNKRDSRFIPEIYIGKGEYEDALYNDKLDLTSFFYCENSINLEERKSTSTVALIFQTKLNKLFPQITHRADEEFINYVISILNKSPYEFKIKKVIKGVDKVYEEFMRYDREHIKFTDMGNFFVCRLDIEISYTYDLCQQLEISN